METTEERLKKGLKDELLTLKKLQKEYERLGELIENSQGRIDEYNNLLKN